MTDAHDSAKRPENRRTAPRIDARIQVSFNTGSEFSICYSKNISRGGIFLETPVLPDPNANVELVLDLSKISADVAGEEVTILSRVVRLMTVTEDGKSIHKVALQFLDPPPRLQLLLDQLYQRVSS